MPPKSKKSKRSRAVPKGKKKNALLTAAAAFAWGKEAGSGLYRYVKTKVSSALGKSKKPRKPSERKQRKRKAKKAAGS